MGNAASGTLPFKVSDKVEFDIPQGVCELLKAVRTDKDELPVSIFKYAKPSSRHAIALRHWHKLRVLKHPYVISYIDGVELDDSIMVVTEDTVPLKNYIKSRMSGSGEASITSEEVIWGLKCICQAISFLHANCSVIHGFLGLHAIFVSKNGDWKVGCFDLMSNPCQSEDELFFSSNEGILSDKYRSPERNNIKSLPTPLPVDVYSLGVLLQEVFSLTGFEVPADLDQLCRRMMMSEARRRPSLALILKSPCFAGERMQMMSTLDELLLKSNAEASEALAQFSTPESISPISVELCSFKLMPCVGRILTTALEEFQLRDSREAARQSIQNTLKLLSLLGGNGKLSEAPFSRTCLAQVTTLWTLSDRAVRTALLRTLPAIVAFIPATVVNGKVFDSLLNGFADNNLKMREDTLKSLVCLLDKLDEKNLQDKLVRCMCGLQADAEAAIRTNATIFLGRIAPKLKDAIKAKVLCSAYAKAIKDPFIHCRY
jgi:SCY1-like protein 1